MKSIKLSVGIALLIGIGKHVGAEDLLDIYSVAKDNDPTFLAAELQRQANLEAYPQARSALLPQISASGSLSHTDQDRDSVAVAPSGDSQSTLLRLDIQQSIYQKSQYVALSQADLQVEQANTQYAMSEQALLLRSAERYFAVLSAEDNLKFASAEKKAIAKQLKQAKKRFEFGLIAITDATEAQARYDVAVAQEIAASNQLAAAHEDLKALTGQYLRTLQPLSEDTPLDSPKPLDIDAWVELANAHNYQLRLVQLDAQIAKKGIDLRRAARLPNTELYASYTQLDSSRDLGDSTDYEVGIRVTVPIYTGGAISSQIRQARANYNIALQQAQLLRRTVEQQTRNAYRNIVADASRVTALKQALLSTQRSAEATQAGYDVGTRTAADVLAALRETYRARADYANARYSYIINGLTLKQEAGILMREDLEQVNRWLQR